jgi:TRAP-type C4-dicarboxylate transport system substrate-binding protein/ribosomal protein S21
MKCLKIGLVLLVTFVLVGGVWGAAKAPETKAPAVKAAAAKAPAAKEPATRDNRKLFGYNVEGLPPVKLIMCSDSAFGTVGDANAVIFERMIEEESKGKIQIDHHRFGSLYTGPDMPKVIPMGTIDMGTINKGYLMPKAPEYCPWVIAYIWKNREHMLTVSGSPEWYEMEDSLAAKHYNMKPLSHVCYGNWDYWANVPIKTMDDFKGKRFWSYGELSNAYISSWGGSPVILARAETYMSYYKKAIDGVSNSSAPYFDGKYYEAGKYWLNMPTYPPHSAGFHYVQLYMNLKKWKSLPEAYKRIILDAADVYSWNSIWEILCLEASSEYQMIHDHGLIDMGISTKNPQEYKRICERAVEAGRKYAMEKRGVTQAQWDAAKAILAKYADPKLTDQYVWWHKMADAENARRINEALKRIKAGEPKAKVWESFHPRRFYEMPYEKVKAEWLKTPRAVRDWPMDARLK